MGHHPHLYVFTFSNYFLSSCLSLTVFALPEFSRNHSILFLLYSFRVEKNIFVVCFFNKRHSLSHPVIHFTLLFFNGPGLSPALFFNKHQGK